ncbi:MAG: hypothetical protein BM563_06450 [Bacteroidetes bacterium MedPE-SWsnd-G1]|nr:MAG: hypothetical protein BM563_06450 [Bacteroidetes bacterium MedPE-SWsnd-G1]
MSFELKFLKDRVIANFEGEVKAYEIKDAFIDIVENVSIKKLDLLIFDFTEIISYTPPKDYLETLRLITLFSSTWNPQIKVAIIALETNIRMVMNEVIKRQEEFTWEFKLFDNLESGRKWCQENVAK